MYFFLMEKATVDHNNTSSVELSAPLIGLVFKISFWSAYLTVP